MIAVDPFVLEKAPLGIGLLLGLWAVGLVGLWLCFGGRRRKRERRLAGAGLVFAAGVLTVLAFTSGVRVSVSCKAGRFEVDHYGPAWSGDQAFPVSQVREVVVGLGSPSPGDHRPPPKVLVMVLTSGEKYVLSNGPWRGYGSSERAAGALSAALARCGPSPTTGGR